MAYRGGGEAVDDRVADVDGAMPAAAPSIVPDRTHSPAAPRRSQIRHRAPRLSSNPEIDCVRHLLPPHILEFAKRRAAQVDVGGDRVLIDWGFISETRYVAALAAYLGVTVEPLIAPARHHCPLDDTALLDAGQAGMLPLDDGDGLTVVVAPCLVDGRRLVQLALTGAESVRRLRLTTATALQDFVTRHAASEIERRTVADLHTTRPDLSAVGGRPRRLTVWTCAAVVVALAALYPGPFVTTAEFALGFVFTAWTALRLFGFLSERLVPRQPRTFADDTLPTYSIVIALYREAAAVGELVSALYHFDYPIEKLDIKLVVEPDDHATRDAIARLQLAPPFEVIVAPPSGPRTKPKALNAALPFVRGKFVAVFDAEDRPDRNQLRLALDAFVAGDERLACVQARLTIDNTADSWLTRGIMAQTPQAAF